MIWKMNLSVEVDVEPAGVGVEQIMPALNALMDRCRGEDANFLSMLLVDTLGRLTKQAIQETIIKQEQDKYGKEMVDGPTGGTAKAFIVAGTRMRDVTAFGLSCKAQPTGA